MAYPGQYSTSGKRYAPPPQTGYATPQGPPPSAHQQYGGYPPQQYGQPAQPPTVQQYGPPPPQYQPPPYPGGGPPPPSGYQQPSGGAPPPPYPVAPQGYVPPQQQQGPQPFYQYSNCAGNKKALLIGINYIGTSNALAGCINDVRTMQSFLIERYGYKPDDMVILTDDQRDPRSIPTRQNIIQAMQWLVAGAQPNDALFFHYSGHGGQVEDLDGDEDDGYDECIYPIDHEMAGPLIDDIMHDIMVRPLPPGCRLTAIFDSCHSGTALDLPFIYSTKGVVKEPDLLKDAGTGLMSAGMSYMRGDLIGMVSGIGSLAKKAMNGPAQTEMVRQIKFSPADVIMWSGCKDSQTSADAVEAGRNTGAMSWAFETALSKYPNQSYLQLLNTIRDELAGKYSQKPQLSASHPMDLSQMFIM